MDENVNNEVVENVKEEETQELMVSDFRGLSRKSKTKRNIYTTITDTKKIFNLESNCDYRINDCKGELIRVKDVLIKINEKPLDNPVIDETIGEITKTHEVSMVTILIDDNDKSYVTGSKIFTMNMIKYIEMFGMQSIKDGLEIKIIETSVKNSANKALGFELV